MNLIECVRGAWGWTGIKPKKVVGENDFGNLLVQDEDGKYWRICPEELTCNGVAEGKSEFGALEKDEEFQNDWNMSDLVSLALECVGPLAPGRKYCLKIPGVLGGQYTSDNLSSIEHVELIDFSGYLARQIKDLPDGTNIKLLFDGRA